MPSNLTPIQPANATTNELVRSAVETRNLTSADILDRAELYMSMTSDSTVPQELKQTIISEDYIDAVTTLGDTVLTLTYWCDSNAYGPIPYAWVFGIPFPVDCDLNGEPEAILDTALLDLQFSEDQPGEVDQLQFRFEVVGIKDPGPRPGFALTRSPYCEISDTVAALEGDVWDTAGREARENGLDPGVLGADPPASPSCDAPRYGVGRGAAHLGLGAEGGTGYTLGGDLETSMEATFSDLATGVPRGVIDVDALLSWFQSPHMKVIVTSGDVFNYGSTIRLFADSDGGCSECRFAFRTVRGAGSSGIEVDTSPPSGGYNGDWGKWELYAHRGDKVVEASSSSWQWNERLPHILRIENWDLSTEHGIRQHFRFQGVADDFYFTLYKNHGAQELIDVTVWDGHDLDLVISAGEATGFDLATLNGKGIRGWTDATSGGYDLEAGWAAASRVRFLFGPDDPFAGDSASFVLQAARLTTDAGYFDMELGKDWLAHYEGRLDATDGTDNTYIDGGFWLTTIGDDTFSWNDQLYQGESSETEVHIPGKDNFRSYIWHILPDASPPDTCLLTYSPGVCA